MQMDPEQLKHILQTFRGELEERLQIITSGLLALEKKDTEENISNNIESIFRAAHNIKGTARSLGIEGISEIAHHIESLFSNIQKKVKSLNSDDIDLCLEAVDKMRLAMQAFSEKQELTFDLADLLKRLDHRTSQKNSNIPEIINKKVTEPISEKKPSIEFLDHETLRVSVDNINQVNTLLEEMQINHIALRYQFDTFAKIAIKTDELRQLWNQINSFWESTVNKNTSETIKKTYQTYSDLLVNLINDINSLYHHMRNQINEMNLISNALQSEASMLRLVPAAFWLQTLPRTVRDLSRELHKEVELHITGEDVKIDKGILEGLKDPIIHLIRNAIDHGIETKEIRLSHQKPEIGNINFDIKQEGNEIILNLSDDGAGIDIKKVAEIALKKNMISDAELKQVDKNHLIDFIFRPGFSTKDIITDVSGRGIGLDVVKANITELKGQISIVTDKDKGTTFILRLPLTLVGERGLIVRSSQQTFAIPSHAIIRIIRLNVQEIRNVEGGQVIMLDNHPVPLRHLSSILRLDKRLDIKNDLSIIVIQAGWRMIAVLVDEILTEEDIVIKPLSAPLTQIPCVAGGTLSGKGDVILVLNPFDLIKQASEIQEITLLVQRDSAEKIAVKPHILVVDDSITTRTLEKSILENKGYQVTIAVDGKEAWDLLQKEKFSLLITDVVMPNMDGFALTESVKKSNHLKDLPVIIVTSLGSEAEKKQGIRVGADAYIVKSAFESGALLEIVAQLL